ncbi:MAG: hypothetical protein C0524_05885 [Rhodobacter sp.]|nr:hypothetical protein [Rhodobacter sp.]
MKTLTLALALTALPVSALAEGDPPLGADAFEALVQGKTMDTRNSGGLYGVETFLPGRRAIWRDATQCLEGTWRAEGDMICFDYIGEPKPYCWSYHDRGGWLMARLDGDRATGPILLYPSRDFVTCDGFPVS